MRTLLNLYRKELKTYFYTLFGWVVLAFVALMQGLSLSTAMKGFADAPVAQSLVYVTYHTPNFWFYFLFIFPLITMRLFAEEERSGTLETLLTAPVKTWQVVLAKYFAAYTFYLVILVPGALHFFLFPTLTDIPAPFSQGSFFGAILVLVLMGAYFTALGLLGSALTSSQIVAGIITIGLLVFHYFLGYVPVIWGENFQAAGIFTYLSSQRHLADFTTGLIDTRALAFYLFSAALVVFLTHHLVDYRRWRN
ncbi:ABC transporter permease [Roseibacillus ishigakijimensis]|uniref:ABC transporter permease subunit n=1 Tax=Roseibacillus ishigakijimensis TaxID=454146 RepID=A0A934RMY0_9BACT|nr:ABC transporter permease subunit [Roseibacillus ishigakijimensis]MBK1834757.1 ABC transporter permease subunit [Roseibacillus ishigakijimensis]